MARGSKSPIFRLSITLPLTDWRTKQKQTHQKCHFNFFFSFPFSLVFVVSWAQLTLNRLLSFCARDSQWRNRFSHEWRWTTTNMKIFPQFPDTILAFWMTRSHIDTSSMLCPIASAGYAVESSQLLLHWVWIELNCLWNVVVSFFGNSIENKPGNFS